MLAAPALINRSITNYWAWVSGKGNRIIPRWRPNKKRKGHLTPRSETKSIICHLPDPPCFSLVTTFKSREMTRRAQTLPWWLGGEGIKMTENQNSLVPLFQSFHSTNLHEVDTTYPLFVYVGPSLSQILTMCSWNIAVSFPKSKVPPSLSHGRMNYKDTKPYMSAFL